MTLDLSTTVAGIRLTTCLYNASGPRSGTAAALQKVAKSASGAVLTKSATLESQTGNPQPRTWHSADNMASLNSEGLPNSGIDYYISEDTYNESMEGADDGKPFFVSLSGKTLKDNLEMLMRVSKSKAKIAAIEMNLACPNVIGKPIIGYDFDQMEDILKAVESLPCHKDGSLPPLGVKLPPYLDGLHFSMAATVLNKHKELVRYVCTMNTLGNATAIDVASDAPVISSNSGFAGLSGPVIRYTALANVRKLRSLLDADIDVVGVGGITTGQDVLEFLLAGATACQIATAHWKEGPTAFDRILKELESILLKRGCKSILDIQGKLKEWSKEGAAKSRAAAKATGAAIKVTGAATQAGAASGGTFFKILSAVLAVVTLLLLADKFISDDNGKEL